MEWVQKTSSCTWDKTWSHCKEPYCNGNSKIVVDSWQVQQAAGYETMLQVPKVLRGSRPGFLRAASPRQV